MSDSKKISVQDKARASVEEARPTTSWHWILAGVLFSGMLITCLMCAIGLWWFRPRIEENPERAAQMLGQMVRIDLPADYEPHGIIDWNLGYLLSLKGVYYELYNGDGILTVVQVGSRFGGDQGARNHIRETLLEVGGGGAPLTIDAAKTRQEQIIIDGASVPFRYDVAESLPTRQIFHLVEGVVAGRDGNSLLIILRIGDGHWKDDSVRAMLESIQPR